MTTTNVGNRRASGHSGRRAIVDTPRFLLATRDSGYRSTAFALAELVDNAIQAGAGVVDVQVMGSGDADHPIELRVVDDGPGMDDRALESALSFGGSTRFDDRLSLGRYGMGLPNGSLSRARRVEVYCWEADHVRFARLDLDELVVSRRRSLPPVEHVPRPAFIPSSPSGTAVRLLRCDRLEYQRPTSLARRLTGDLGRVYRRFIADGLDLRVNGEVVEAFDPLFLLPSGRTSGARQFGDDLRYELEGESGSGVIVVRFSELPIERWHQLPAPEKRSRGITTTSTVSVLRAGREIDHGWLLMGTKRRQNYDSWWRCEISFDPCLDEMFGITHTKQTITPTKALTDRLTPDLESIANSLSNRVRLRFETLKTAGPLRAAAEQADQAERTLPAITGGSDPIPDRLRALVADYVGSEAANAGSYTLLVADTSTTGAFECFVRDRRLIVVINSHHPFYRDILAPQAESEAQRDQDMAKRIVLAVLAVARAQVLRPGGSRSAGRRFSQTWSDVLTAYLNV
jgi:hypothetical protein